MTDVFVSYSRRDNEFVARLVESISARGKEVWLDTEGIADAEVFPDAIKRAIEGSDAFLFVITPSAVHSAFCENEVEYARELQKRIVPVLRQPVPDSELPGEIRDRNWIPFSEDADYDAGLTRLLAALDTDLAAVKAHTRWLVKALEWDSEQRDKSFLLRGSELKAAEEWLASRPEEAEPAPTPLQREYLLASRQAAASRQRALLGGAVAIAAVSVGLLIFALISRGQAVAERVSARAQALAAESQAQLPNDPEISLILGMRAVKTQATPQTLFALRAALDASPLERGFPTIPNPGSCGLNSGLAAAVSPDGRQIAEGACTGLVRILDAASGRVLKSKNLGVGVSSLAYAANGSALALGTAGGVTMVNPHTEAVTSSTTSVPEVMALAFAPNGATLAVDSGAAYDSAGGLSLGSSASLSGATQVNAQQSGSLAFSPDGQRLYVGELDASVSIYTTATRRLVHRIRFSAPGGSWPLVVAVSRNGRQLAVGYPLPPLGVTSAVSIYSTATWRKERTVMSLPEVQISALAFSPDGAQLAVGAEDGTAGVWSVATSQEVASYEGPTAAIDSIQFTPDGDSVLTASADGVARLWRAIGVEQSVQTLPLSPGPQQIAFGANRIETVASQQPVVYSAPIAGGQAPRRLSFANVQTVALSPDGRLAMGLGTPGPLLTLWDGRTGRVVRKLTTTAQLSPGDGQPVFSWNDASIAIDQNVGTGSGAVIVSLTTGRTVSLQSPTECSSLPQSFAFSRDERRVAGFYFCGIADVWDTRTGQLLREVNEGGEASSVDLSPNGSRLLVSSWDSRATIWSVATGRRLVSLIGDTRGLSQAAFSPDGSLVATTSLDHTVRIWNSRSGQVLRVLTLPDDQAPLAFNADGSQFAVAEADPAPSAPDVVRVFDTCPACTNAHALLSLAAPHVTGQLTVLERTVVGNS